MSYKSRHCRKYARDTRANPKRKNHCHGHGRRAKRAKRRGHNVHHIYCQARFPKWRHETWNKVLIKVPLHDLYHRLFNNLTPAEIIDYLVESFWKGYVPENIEILKKTPYDGFYDVRENPRLQAYGQSTKIHIYCPKRFPEYVNEDWNVVSLEKRRYDRYVWLFRSRTPEEIIEYLVSYFWGGHVPKSIVLRKSARADVYSERMYIAL